MKIDGNMQLSYVRMATAQRITKAADDPAGLAIAQKMNAQVNGYDQGTENIQSGQDLMNTADGALSSIQDSLGRMRELAVQASNGILTDSDKGLIQKEIDQLKAGIQETARNTEFNTMKLVDGTFSDKTFVSGPNGSGRNVSIQNTSLESLGIDQFDVTKAFDISTIDGAISKVSESRSNIGSAVNAMDSMVRSNEISSQNLREAESKISGADLAELSTVLKQQQLQQQVSQYAQQQKAQQGSSLLNLLR